MAIVPLDFGVNETTAFYYCLEGMYGRNQNFPSGPLTNIVGVTNPWEFWDQYFRYLVHFRSGTPPLRLLRVAVGFDFDNEHTFNFWSVTPTAYHTVFSTMVNRAEAAGVHLIPVIMHGATQAQAARYLTESTRKTHLVAFARDLMSTYDSTPAIVGWDLLNEPHPLNASTYAAWVTDLVSRVRSAGTKPLTIGHDLESLRDEASLRLVHQALDVWQDHFYAGLPFADPGNLDALAGWASRAGKPWFAGELGHNDQSYFPEGVAGWLSRAIGPVCAMALWGTPAYADYPYTGVLPDYPSGPPPGPPPPPPTSDHEARITALEKHGHGPPVFGPP